MMQIYNKYYKQYNLKGNKNATFKHCTINTIWNTKTTYAYNKEQTYTLRIHNIYKITYNIVHIIIKKYIYKIKRNIYNYK